MAVIGLKYPVASEMLTEASPPSYDTGFVIGKAIAANVSISGGEPNVLYADDGPAESNVDFEGGAIEIGLDDLGDENYAKFLGHSYEDGVVTANSNDVAPYFGVGFYRTRIKNGVKSYRTTWLYKVQFGEPAESGNTKGKTIEWQTPSLTGNILMLPNGDWKKQATFSTADEAVAFLNALANIGSAPDKSALAAEIVSVQELDEDLYTASTWGPVYYALQVAISVNSNPYATQAQIDAALDDLQAKVALLEEIGT